MNAGWLGSSAGLKVLGGEVMEMLDSAKLRMFLVLACSTALLIVATGTPLVAQATAGTILGTVTDSSGGGVPDAAVQVTNTGTAAVQTTTTDAQGRYRVPDLPVATYDVQTEKSGFETVVHKGVTLTVGSDSVVDFSLPVGQVTQAVTVEAEVSQVETQSSTISNLVDQQQMRELPLNGRSYEQLILLSPGVTIMQAISTQPNNGAGASYSVSGSRTRGQWELLDDNDITNWQGRNSGSGVLGTALGIDSIAEFQMLTNTYSAQYGGNGGVMNSVTKSGTNGFHGSAYEFLRNSALDARNFFDPPTIPSFRKNQFGGTFGGPIKKDKIFFFVNYEGLRQDTGLDQGFILPDAQAHSGFVPNASGVYTCVNSPAIPYANGANNAACLATVPASIQPFLNYLPPPSAYPCTPNLSTGLLTGLVTCQETAQSPGREDYVVGRYDWTISPKDSMFARYLRDSGSLYLPFINATLSPAAPTGSGAQTQTLNQFLSIEEKHIASNNLIISTRFGFTRTVNYAYSTGSYPIYNFGQPNLWASSGYGTSIFPSGPQGTISIRSIANPLQFNLGGLGGGSFLKYIQNKFSGGQDVFWSKGAHSLQLGGSIMRVQSYNAIPAVPGGWQFANVSSFLTLSPTAGSSTAVCNSSLWSACGVLPTLQPLQHFQESDFGFYVQDSWKVRSTVTVNLGLRYSPMTNPVAVGNTREYLNMPYSATFNPALPMPGCFAPGSCPLTLTPGTLPSTPVHRVYEANPSFHNFDPRVGIAWDPFKDHKTSVRAGYGIFHSPVLPFDYTTFVPLPYSTTSFSCPSPCSTFPLPPFSAGGAVNSAPVIQPSGIDPGIRSTPYMQQYNLTVQREIAHNTTLSVGYVGSRGLHLIGLIDENPPLPTGVPGAITTCAAGCNLTAGQTFLPFPAVGTQLAAGIPAGAVTTGYSPASATGQAIIDPTTGQESYSNVVCAAGGGKCSVVSNNRIDPAISVSSMKSTLYSSHYNALEASVARRLTSNFQAQVAYTWSSCLSNSGGSGPQENAVLLQNTYNINGDEGNCAFYIRHTVSVNAMYIFPFKRNRLVSGWELTGIYMYPLLSGESCVKWA
jgi:Carboxypeptidase regulatory-like domain